MKFYQALSVICLVQGNKNINAIRQLFGLVNEKSSEKPLHLVFLNDLHFDPDYNE